MFSTKMSKVAPSLTSMVALVFPPTRISVAWRTYTDKNFSINISIIYLFIYFHLLLVKELPCWTSGHTENNLLKRRIASKWGKVCDDGNPEITLVKVTTLPFLSRFFRFSFQFVHLLNTTRLSCNQKEQISKQRIIMWPKWQNVCRKFQVHLSSLNSHFQRNKLRWNCESTTFVLHTWFTNTIPLSRSPGIPRSAAGPLTGIIVR